MSSFPSPRGAPPAGTKVALEEVRTTALMARLRLQEAELPAMAVELERSLELAASLGEVDVRGVEPTTHAVPLSCPLREDVVGPHDAIEDALRNAPATEARFFTVPAILTDDDHGKPPAL